MSLMRQRKVLTMMEKADYRINLEMLKSLFPDCASISTEDTAKALKCSVKTVRSAIRRKNNPLPAVKISSKMFLIPIPSLARWMSDVGR